MALGRNKEKAVAAAAPAAIEEEEDEAGGLFGEEEPEESELMTPPPAAPAASPLPPSAPSGGADALLSMFQSTESEGEDRSAVLDLAGDVELSDLLEDLHTVAAALGVRRTA